MKMSSVGFYGVEVNTEDGSDTLLRIVGNHLQDNIASLLRLLQSIF
jgi:hypothetical protein